MYNTKDLINYGMRLADLQNSQFITFGDKLNALNSSYREVYNDLIKMGDNSYVKTIKLNGSGKYRLPYDFYQLKSIDCKRDLEYTIQNNSIILNNVKNATMEYYPAPLPLSLKSDRIAISLPSTPISGYSTNVLCSNGYIYDLSTKSNKSSSSSSISSTAILGFNSYMQGGYEKTFTHGNIKQANTLYENGTFHQDSRVSNIGWASNDGRYLFSYSGNKLSFYDGERLVKTWDYNSTQGRYLFYGNMPAFIGNNAIYFANGNVLTTDSNGVLLKADKETGYGYVVNIGNAYYLEGAFSDTELDFPNSVLFDLMAYKCAIYFRRKQNSDYSSLQNGFNDLYETYVSSMARDDFSYPTIRNVDYRSIKWMRI